MRPILFELPGWEIKVHSYGVMIFVACMAALETAVWRARREKIDPNVVYELATWLFLGGVIGARGLYVLFHPETIHHLGDIIRSWQGGNVFYGCILGGLTGSLIYWYRHPFPFWSMADAVAPAVAVGIAFGRIGCFLNGCCYGAVCDVPWAVRFPLDTLPWIRQVDSGLISLTATTSLPVHPSQLYASIAGFIILGLLLAYTPYRRCKGEVIALLMILYSLTRWPVEALRGDERAIFAGMTLSQNISVVVLVCGFGLWFTLRRSGAGAVKARNPRSRLVSGRRDAHL
jgi:phosphatidylglycerol:prolipoprotein diacylglycerol transferase